MGKSQGDELLAKAEKKGSSSVGWFSSQSGKWEEAGDLFQQVSCETTSYFLLDSMPPAEYLPAPQWAD